MIAKISINKETGIFCYICGKTRSLTFHHLKDLGKIGKKHNSIIKTNLIKKGILTHTKDQTIGMPLCRVCHTSVEEAKDYVNLMKRFKKAYNLGFKQGLEYKKTANSKQDVKNGN